MENFDCIKFFAFQTCLGYVMARRDLIILMSTLISSYCSSSVSDDVRTSSSLNNIPSSSDKPDQYNQILNVFPPSSTAASGRPSSDIVRVKLLREDYHYDVKILPIDHQVSIYLLEGQVKRLVLPLTRPGPLTISVTPCVFPVAWTISLRPHQAQPLWDTPTSGSAAPQVDNTRNDSQSHTGDGYGTPGNPVHSSDLMRRNRSLGSVSSGSYIVHKNRSLVLNTSNLTYKYSKPVRRTTSDVTLSRVKNLDELEWQARIITIRSTNDSGIIKDMSPVIGRKESVKEKDEREDVEENEKEEKEVLLERYEGQEPFQFQRRMAEPGLYLLQVEGLGGSTHVHIYATLSWQPLPPTSLITATRTPTPAGKAVTLRWTSSVGVGGYCLVVSEGRPFSSLCAARAALQPAHRRGRRLHRGSRGSPVVLGCTTNPWYRLPHTPRRPLHVTVWADGRAGPPLGHGLVPATPKRRVPRLRPGELLKLVPSAAGKAVAKFRVRRGIRRLHVIAVACGAKLRLKVESRCGERVASAKGGVGALQLAVPSPSPEALILALKTSPPGAASQVLLTAAHDARALPLPRLPRNFRVKVGRITCNSATFRWSAGPGSQSYCILLQEDRSGKAWRPRPPIQCGWEAALRQLAHYAAWWCGPPTPAGRQRHTLNTLTPSTTYTANVLVRHPSTGHALSLTPAHLTTSPTCRTPARVTPSP
ncbi:uncharacterized protein [Panulirus ornatus]|uniref:uncharacterized protein n=1 Tax=Panulirus ornatus TaxID=150431 RepID=UPI003A847EB7